MSSHKNKRQTYTNGSANRLGSDSSSKARFGSGLVSLGAAPKGGKTTSGKLAAPPPVNLPSLRKEHAGNDPNAQLVGTSAGWNSTTKTTSQDPTALSTGSHWASSTTTPADTRTATHSSATSSARQHLSAADYPSLQAAAKASNVPASRASGLVAPHNAHAWEEDERGVRGGGEQRGWDNGGGYYERDGPGGGHQQGHQHRPPPPPRQWGHDDAATPSNRNWRDADPSRGTSRSSFGSRGWQEEPDRWGSSSGRDGDRWGQDRRGGSRYSEPHHNGYGPPGGHHSHHHHHHHQGGGGGGGSALLLQDDPLLDDVALFPPGPSTKHRSSGALEGQDARSGGGRTGGVLVEDEEEDPERAAFEHELEQLASQLHKQREGATAPPPPAHQPASPTAAAAEHTSPTHTSPTHTSPTHTSPTHASPTHTHRPAPPPRVSHEVSVEREAAREAARKQQGEEERARKQAAALKLQQLEQRIAARQEDAVVEAMAQEVLQDEGGMPHGDSGGDSGGGISNHQGSGAAHLNNQPRTPPHAPTSPSLSPPPSALHVHTATPSLLDPSPSPYAFGTNLAEEVVSMAKHLSLSDPPSHTASPGAPAERSSDVLGALPADLYPLDGGLSGLGGFGGGTGGYGGPSSSFGGGVFGGGLWPQQQEQTPQQQQQQQYGYYPTTTAPPPPPQYATPGGWYGAKQPPQQHAFGGSVEAGAAFVPQPFVQTYRQPDWSIPPK